MVLADILKSTALKKKKKSKELSVNMEVNKHLKKFSENVKMKCILFKNNKKFRGFGEWGFFELMADPGFNYCFCSWLVGRMQPGAGLSFALLSMKVQNFPHSRWYLWKPVNLCSGDCWQKNSMLRNTQQLVF